MLAVTRWFLSTFYGSFHERCANGSEKKPYNPILGEQFFCEMEPDATKGDNWPKTSVIVEQGSFPSDALYLLTRPIYSFPSSSHHCVPLDECKPGCRRDWFMRAENQGKIHAMQKSPSCSPHSKFKSMTVKVEQVKILFSLRNSSKYCIGWFSVSHSAKA